MAADWADLMESLLADPMAVQMAALRVGSKADSKAATTVDSKVVHSAGH